MVESPGSFVPNVNTYSFYLFFYLTGWLLFKSKKHLDTLIYYDKVFIVLAIILSIIRGLMLINSSTEFSEASPLSLIFSSLIVCLFMFGITGLFIRYGSKPSKLMRYISDSSYWVYLIHLPITAIIPAFIWELPFPAIVKFLIVLFVTTIICFVSYHFLVRNSFIGKFLNGRKYPLRNF